MYRIINAELLLRRYSKQMRYLAWDVQATEGATYTMRYMGTGTINWGDGVVESLATAASATSKSHTYTGAGLYPVKITGNITWIQAGDATASRNMVRTLRSMNLPGYLGNSGSFSDGEFFSCSNATIAEGCTFAFSTTSLYYTFYGCTGLTSLPSGLIPTGYTGSLESAFRSCTGLTSLPTGLIPTGYTGSLYSTFSGCTGLTSLPTGLIPSGVNSLNATFSGCTGLTSLPTGLIPTGYTGSLSYTFSGCTGLTSLPTSLIPTGVTSLNNTFHSCTGLTTIPSDIWPASWTSTNINIGNMFYRASAQSGKPTGTVPANKLWNASAGTFGTTDGAFYNCTSLANYADIPLAWR